MGNFFKSEGNTKLQSVQEGLTRERKYSYDYFHKRYWIFKCLSHPQVLLSSAALSDFLQSVLTSGIAPIQMQHPALQLFKLHEVLTDPLLRFVQAPLNDVPSFWCVNSTVQLVPPEVFLRLYSISLCHWWWYWRAPVPRESPEDTTHHWPPAGHRATDHNFFRSALGVNCTDLGEMDDTSINSTNSSESYCE